jgi:hypothetical protein
VGSSTAKAAPEPFSARFVRCPAARRSRFAVREPERGANTGLEDGAGFSAVWGRACELQRTDEKPPTRPRRPEANFLEPDSKLDEYREVRAALGKTMKEVLARADEPRVVADVVLEAASAARPKLRYTAGGLARRLRFLRRLAPSGLVDAGIRKDLQIDALTANR